MERLKVKSIQGTAKLVGITVCMGGVIILAIYKGPLLKLPLCPHFYHGQEHPHRNNPGHVSGGSTSWLKGCVLMITSNILWGLWLVLQVFKLLHTLLSIHYLNYANLSNCDKPIVINEFCFIFNNQGRVLKVYPSKLYFTTLHCLLSSIQSFVIAIALERDISAWKLGWNLRLVAVIYCVNN